MYEGTNTKLSLYLMHLVIDHDNYDTGVPDKKDCVVRFLIKNL